MEELDWTAWYPLQAQPLAVNVPDKPGIYEIRADYKFGRLRGSSRVVYIGSAARGPKPSLRKRIGPRVTNPERYLSTAEKFLVRAGHALEFRFSPARDGKTAKVIEIQRLMDYQSDHWEAPPGVSKRLG